MTGRSTSPAHPSSRHHAVVEMDHAVGEAAFVEEFELQADVVGECLRTATHHDGRDDQVALVRQSGAERLAGEVRAAHGEVPAEALIRRISSTSKVRSSRVLALDTVCSVVEYTILSAARQIAA